MIRRLFALLFILVGFAVIAAAGFALFWSDELQRIYVPTLPSLERHSGNLIAVVEVTHDPDEARDRADLRIAGAKLRDFSTDIKVRSLHANAHLTLP